MLVAQKTAEVLGPPSCRGGDEHVWFGAVTTGTKTASADGLLTVTAKHLGDGSSPSNYYQTGGGSVVGDSPLDWAGLIPAPNGSGACASA